MWNVLRGSLLFVTSLVFSGCRVEAPESNNASKSACDSVGAGKPCKTGKCGESDRARDGDLSTAARIDSKPGSTIEAWRGPKGRPFPAGAHAGAFVTLPNEFSDGDLILSTFLGNESVPVQKATGADLAITPTHGDPAHTYVSFRTTAPFSGVRLTLKATSREKTAVYEICGAAEVK
jgi:hypothetical protein